MKKPFLILFFIFVYFSVFLHPDYTPFYTYYNFMPGTKALAMGNAFVGVADDLTAVYNNPAGIAKFRFPTLYASYKTDAIHYDYEPQVKDFADYSQEYNYHFAAKLKNINFLAISVPVVFWDVKWNFALSYYRYIPYGFKGYAQTALETRVGFKNTDSVTANFSGSSGIDVLGFTTAFPLIKNVAFGFTLQQFFNSGTINYDSFPGNPGSGALNRTENFEGRNVIFGLFYNISENITLGIAYHTRLTGTLQSLCQYPDEEGDNREINTAAALYLPEKFSTGAGFRLLETLTISYEFFRAYWSKGRVGDLPFPLRDNSPFNQVDMINHRVGAEYVLPLKKWSFFLRSGFSRDRQLFRAADADYVTVRGYALGCGIFFSPGFSLELAYMQQRAKWLEAGYFDSQPFVKTFYKNHSLSFAVNYYVMKKK